MLVQADGFQKDIVPVLLEKAYFNSDIISLFTLYTFAVQIKYKDYILAVSPVSNTIFKQKADLDVEIIEKLDKGIKSAHSSIENFAEVKYYLDKLFYEITEKGVLEYTYQSDYLMTSYELGKLLNISRATIHRYKELGLESVDTIGHKSYPAHNVFYWSEGVWAARIQVLYQSFKVRSQTKESLIAEMEKELDNYKKVYGGSFEEVFKDLKDPYELDEPDDYFNWRDLIEELKDINEQS